MPEFDMALVERINTAIRSVNIRFGPNALAIMGADGTVPLSQGESWHMAIAVADELFGDGQDNAAVVQRLLDAKDTALAQALEDRARWDRLARQAIAARQAVDAEFREWVQNCDNAVRDRDQARHQAALRTPLICSDERHQAKVAALEAEVRGLEEKVAWLAASHGDGLDLIIQLSDERDRLRDQLAAAGLVPVAQPPGATELPCSLGLIRTFQGQPREHHSHTWEPQPGVTPVWCPGITAAPKEPHA